MVVRVRSLAALTVAALPLSAHASSTSVFLPNFSCDAAGNVNGINWGDNSSFPGPSVGVTGADGELLPAVQFGCDSNMYSVPIQGSTFSVNFGLNNPGPNTDLTLKFTFGTTEYKVQDAAGAIEFVTQFDIYGSYYKEQTDGSFILDYKDFVGMKYVSALGDAVSPNNTLSLNADGELILDPPIGGGSGILELTDTPAVPEPGSLALLGTGLAAAVSVLRRKSRP